MARARKAGKPSEIAPRELHELRQRVHKGAAILDRLLSDKKMRRPWLEIDKRIKASRDVAYQRLWGELVTLLQRSKKTEPSRADVKKEWHGVATKASELAALVRNGRLDLRAFRFYTDDVARMVFSKKWRELDQWQQQDIAYRMAIEWPTLPELLDELAAKAKDLADSAMKEPRLVERTTRDRQLNYFIRGLANYFKANFGGTMNGTLAAIASVVFERNIGIDVVKRSLRQ